MPLLEEHVAAYPNDTVARSMLAIAYREPGREQDARNQASDIMRLNPQYRSPARERLFPRMPILARRYLSDLQRAGLR